MLTHFSFLLAELYRAAELKDWGHVQTLILSGIMFADQSAIQNGNMRLGWLLSGQENPPTNITRAHTASSQDSPCTPLADPRWISANLDYLKDLEVFETRQGALSSTAHPDPPPVKPPRPKRPPKPKDPAKAGATAKR